MKSLNTNMREYLYIDYQKVNSIRSQLEKGIITTKRNIKNNGESSSKTSDKNHEIGVSINKLPLSINGNYGGKRETMSCISHSNEVQDEVIDSDYSINLLEDDLKESNINLKTKTLDAKVGDFIKLNDQVNIIDFEHLAKMTNKNLVTKILTGGNTLDDYFEINELINKFKKINQREEVDKLKEKSLEIIKKIDKAQTAIDNFKNINLFAEFGSIAFEDSILINNDNFNIYADKHNIKMNASQLTTINTEKRKATILGIVEDITDNTKIYSSEYSNELPTLESASLTKVVNMECNILLKNFGLLKDNQLIITPLFIFF